MIVNFPFLKDLCVFFIAHSETGEMIIHVCQIDAPVCAPVCDEKEAAGWKHRNQ